MKDRQESAPSSQPHLKSKGEERKAEERVSIGARIVYEAVRREGEEELQRSTSGLFWSGIAAGLSMGFSLVGMGLIDAALPRAPWTPLVSSVGYCFGFLMVVLGRQQLFTENTLTVILPLLRNRDWDTFVQVLRLWGIVLLSNLIGALAFAFVAGHGSLFRPDIQASFTQIGRQAIEPGFGAVVLKGVFAGWLIALMVWLLPASEGARLHTVVIIMYLIALGRFSHVIAGSIDTLYLVVVGQASWIEYLTRFFLPALIGNIIGGVTIVAAISHAQVVAGDRDD